MRMTSASGGILHDGRSQNIVAEVGRQILWRAKVNLPSDQYGQLAFNGRQTKKTQAQIRLKLDEDVHIAVVPEIGAKHGAKQRQPTDAVSPAESLNLV